MLQIGVITKNMFSLEVAVMSQPKRNDDCIFAVIFLSLNYFLLVFILKVDQSFPKFLIFNFIFICNRIVLISFQMLLLVPFKIITSHVPTTDLAHNFLVSSHCCCSLNQCRWQNDGFFDILHAIYTFWHSPSINTDSEPFQTGSK